MGFEVLHQKIENAQWGAVLEILLSSSGKHQAFSKYGADLPLHMALRSAEEDNNNNNASSPPLRTIIQALIDANPGGASERGRGGSLPLHIASEKRRGADIIRTLIHSYPPGLDEPDETGRTPRDIIASYYVVDGDNDEDTAMIQKISSRPISCFKVDADRAERFRSRDTELLSLEEKLDNVRGLLARSRGLSQSLSERLVELNPHIEDEIAKETVQLHLARERIELLKRDVESFVKATEGRMDQLRDLSRTKSNQSFESRADELKKQSYYAEFYKQITADLATLKKESEKLIEVGKKLPS